MLLDGHGIAWDYEPHTFVLAYDDEGKIAEAFTPDFYLPDADIYIECTTADPSLMARKRRKVRKARELHDLHITLHERHHLEGFRRAS